MKNKMSIFDVMCEAVAKKMDEDHAVGYCRARIHIPRVSAKRLRDYFRMAGETVARRAEAQKAGV